MDEETRQPAEQPYLFSDTEHFARPLPDSLETERTAEVGKFLEQVYGLLASGKKDQAVDLIYDRFDAWLGEKNYAACNETLRLAEVERLGSGPARSMLSLSFRDRESLPVRPEFHRRAYLHIERTQDRRRADRLVGHLQ